MGEAVKGEDPAEERATRRKSLTMKELCDRYLEATDHGLIMGKGNRPKKASTLYIDLPGLGPRNACGADQWNRSRISGSQ